MQFIVAKGLPRTIAAGLRLQGIESGLLREPLQELDEAEVAQLKAILDRVES